MDEEKVVSETTETYSDAGWDETETTEETSEEPVKETETKETETEEAKEESKTDEVKDDTKAEVKEEVKEEPKIHVKHLDEERDLTLDEAKVFAQKGMDYDRVKEKWEDAKDTISFIDAQAKAAGMKRQEFIDYLRTEQKKSSGMTEEDAKRSVELENREAVLAQKEAEVAERAKEAEQDRVADSKREADFKAFANRFPDVDAKNIPKEVWESVKTGESLTVAYLAYENTRLTKEKEALEQKVKNAGKSTGSVVTSGGDTQKDIFDVGWDDD
jgi:hypothetical protein